MVPELGCSTIPDGGGEGGSAEGRDPGPGGFLAPLPLRCRLPRRSPQTRPGTGAGWCRWRPRPAAPRRSPGPPGAGPARRRLRTMTKTKTRRTTRRLLRRRPLPLEPRPRRFPPPPPRPPQPGGRGAPRGRRRRPEARGEAAGPGRVAAGRPLGPGAPRRRRPRWSRVGRGSATDSCAPCSPREVKQREGEATTQGGGEAEGGGRGPRNLPGPPGAARPPAGRRRYAERRAAPAGPASCIAGSGPPCRRRAAATPSRGPGRSLPPARLPRNLDNCVPRPPGAADSGEGGGKEAQEPDAERGFRGEGEGRGLRGGWRRREPHRPQPREPRGRLHTFPGCAGNRTARESRFQSNAAAGSGTSAPSPPRGTDARWVSPDLTLLE